MYRRELNFNPFALFSSVKTWPKLLYKKVYLKSYFLKKNSSVQGAEAHLRERLFDPYSTTMHILKYNTTVLGAGHVQSKTVRVPP